MSELIFSPSTIFRLHQLGTRFFHHSGVRHKLSSRQGITDLLRATANSRDAEITRYHAEFVESLDKQQRDALIAEGIPLQPQSRRA